MLILGGYYFSSDSGNNDDDYSEQADEDVRGRKRPANIMKGTDTNFLYAESKAARLVMLYHKN